MWLMRIFGLIILAFRAVLAVGGVKLASLGGQPVLPAPVLPAMDQHATGVHIAFESQSLPMR